MSILTGQLSEMDVLSYTKSLKVKEIISIIEAEKVKEVGFYHKVNVSDKWLNAQGKSVKIIAALDNNDTELMLLSIIRENTKGVLIGLAIAAYAVDASCLEIVLPYNEQQLVEKINLEASQLGMEVQLSFGIVDVVKEKQSLVHHFETLALIADLFAHVSRTKTPYSQKTVIGIRMADINAKDVRPIEIGFGNTLRTIIESALDSNTVSLGGVDKRVDLEHLKAIGIGTNIYKPQVLNEIVDETFLLGNGVVTLFDSGCCMADQAEKSILSMRKKECGKCTFCREGSLQLHAMLKDITHGKGNVSDIAMMKEIGDAMSFSNLCSIGLTASDTVIDVLTHFSEEVENHIKKKQCQASVCSAFMSIYIDPLTCDGCEECSEVCPVNCIEGKSGFIHMIDEFDCTKCGLCIPKCPVSAIIRTTGRLPKLPERLTRVGRFNKR